MVGRYRYVLVGWDGSAAAAEALGVAVAIVVPRGHVVALSVIRASPRAEPGADADRAQGRLQDEALEAFERLRRERGDVGGVRMTADAITGDDTRAGPAVCGYAAEHGFDLIVLGRCGENGGSTHLGRVARAAALSSPVPVLLIGSR
ncbi:MAG: universal stress protein [Streptosporangiaceae bacterium]